MRRLEGMKPAALAASVLQLTYAINALLNKVALSQGMNARVFVVYRYGIAALFIVPIAFLCRHGQSNPAPIGVKSFSLMFLGALIGVTINQNSYAEGLELTSASIATAMGNTVPAVTFIIAFIVGMEHVNIKSIGSIAKIIGTIICIGGAIVMALVQGPKLLNSTRGHAGHVGSMFGFGVVSEDSSWILGCIFLFGSSCCWAIWYILQVPITRSYPDHIALSGWMCSISTLQAAVLSFVMERDLSIWIPTTTFQIGAVVFSGVVASGISIFVQAWCIAQAGPVFYSMFNPLCTVITFILAAIFLKEEVYTGSIVGATGVVIGLYIVLWGKTKDIVIPNEDDKPLPADCNLPISTVPIDQADSAHRIYLEEPLLHNGSLARDIRN